MLGIVGGVGPKATARLYLSLTNRFSAHALCDLPELLIHSLAMTRELEDAFLAGEVGSRSPTMVQVRAMLGDALGCLARAGADLIAMPCNTLQAELGSLCAARGLEHLDMFEATIETIVESGVRRVMVLGTTTTCRADRYGQRLRPHGIACLYPDVAEQAIVEAHIRGALDLRSGHRSGLAELVHDRARACEGIVLACTDLSGDPAVEVGERPVFDSLECLASAALRRIAPSSLEHRGLRDEGEHGR